MTALGDLTRDSEAIGARIREGVGMRRMLTQDAREARERADALRAEAETLDNVVALLAAMQEVWRGRFQGAVGEVVSQGLAGVFGEALDLIIEMGQHGDHPTARFALRDPRGLETTDIMDARGGGIVNVAAFLLRVLLLLSARPAMNRLLVLDEPFINVSAEYRPAVTALLRRICDEGGFQIIMVSHTPELADAADRAYRFTLDAEGRTVVRLVRAPGEDIAEGGLLS